MKYTLPFVLILLLGACKKTTEAYSVQTTDYESVIAFTNAYSQPLYVDFYANAEDYKYSQNALLNFKIAPGEVYVDSFVTDKKSQTYYVDIYNEGRTRSNWAFWTAVNINGSKNKDSLTEAGLKSTWHRSNGFKTNFDIDAHYFNKTNWRNTFIEGNKPETAWKAVGGENWNALTNDQKYLRLILSKNMRCVYARMQNGVISNTDAWYYVQEQLQPNGGAKLTIEQYNSFYFLNTYKGDTLLLTTVHGDMYMVKE